MDVSPIQAQTNVLQPHSVIPHALEPLKQSWEASQYEADLKALFMQVYESMLRIKFNQINTYGMGHAGDFEVLERLAKQDGIAAYRVAGKDPNIRALYRGWKAHNPRRGTEFLKYYLQLLFPNQWRVEQLYQKAAAVYPLDLSAVKRAGDFRTSRILVTIVSQSATDAQVLALIMPSLRSVIPARLMALIRLLNEFEQNLYVGAAIFSQEVGTYTGGFQLFDTTYGADFATGAVLYGGTTTGYVGAFVK
jgi:hypothetical protein